MIGNLCYALAFICLVLFLLAILGVIAMSWVTLLILALVFAVLGYFLGGARYGRRGPY